MEIAKNKTIILFIIAIIGLIYIGTINEKRYQESMEVDNTNYITLNAN